MKHRWLLLTAATLLAGAAGAADWPQWRGPQRTGISRETGLLMRWPAAGPRLLWQSKEVGFGFSTPAVAAGRLYLISNQGLTDESVRAFDANDGKPLWSTRIGKVGKPEQQPSYPGARSTPTVDGTLLYALGSDGDVAGLETATGKVRWQKHLRTEFGGQPGIWAYSESPLVDGDAVVVTPGGAAATMVALNKKSGAVIWKAAIPGADQAGYSSAIVVNAGGLKQYVQFLQKGVVGVHAKTGQLLWRYDRTAQRSPANIPTPVEDQGMIYTASGLGGAGLVKLKIAGQTVQPEEVYFATRLPNAIGGTVKVGDYLYGTGNAGLLCVNFATGEIKWQERGVGAGSVLYADGLLIVHGENGQVALVEATPAGYREKGKFTPPNLPAFGTNKSWTYPVLANGRLYLRDLGVLSCYDLKG
jgi:outer membrane protein assembly factor BamB